MIPPTISVPQFPEVLDGFDATDGKWYVLGGRTFADVPVSPAGSTGYAPWRIAGDTSAAPDGTNDETGQGDYANAGALEPGHVYPFQTLSATIKSTLASTVQAYGDFPACWSNENINHYRRFVRLAPRMFGGSGRKLFIWLSGRVKATNARNCLDIVIHHDLVTATPATTFTAGKYTGFRWVLGNLGANEVSFELAIVGTPMGPYKQSWQGHLRVAAQTNPESTAPAIDSARGPCMIDLTTTGPNMDTTGSQLAFLFAARGTTGIAFDNIGGAGGPTLDGSEVYVKVGQALALLSPGRK